MRKNISLAILALFVLVPFSGAFAQHTLTVESSAAVGAGGTVYRFYVNANDDTDKFSAVFGNNETHLVISAPDGIFNSPFNASWNASGINPAFLGAFPEMADDSYATIGLEGPASTSGLAGAADPSIVEDSSLNPTISGFFTAGGTMLDVNTLVGGSWYVLNTATNSLPIGGRWLVAQVTTTGSISGTMNYQVFPLGVGDDQKQFSTDFDGAGTFTGTCVIGCEGGPVDVLGCTDPAACNYDSSATLDDGSCASFDACGVCGGAGIPEGDCDCFGNQLDALGVCGGECSEDADADGICDDADECVGTLDACGVCNGPGAIYACGCSEVPSGDCDCDGNQLDACGVCGGDGSSCVGCMDSAASNYNADATTDNGSCVYATTFNVDMSCATNVGAMLNGSTGFSEVFVTGPIFGWAANDGYNQLTDADGDGIYSVTLDFPAGDVEYKYAIDGFADQEQLIDDMQNGADCAPVTDYGGYANRLVVAGSATNDTYGSCSSCADQVDPVNVTFQVDMSQYAEPYAFGGVFVNGSFNGWCGVCNPLTDMGGGLWSVTLPLNPGTIEYKFTLDGWNYQEEFAGGESCTSTIEGYTNRSLTFDADVTLAAVCWESCDVCPDTSDVLGCMDSSANNYNAEATVEPENSCLYDVTLSVDASQTSFTSMTLAGTFNGWNNLSNPMDDSDGDGVYTVTVSMTAGNQEYKFLGNGDWGVAEVFDGSESCTTPPAEFVNRVILVEGPTVADTVCYNTCEACPQGVEGCIDETACNYNPLATEDDGSCLFSDATEFDVMDGFFLGFYDAESGCPNQVDLAGDLFYPVQLTENGYMFDVDEGLLGYLQFVLGPDLGLAFYNESVNNIFSICDNQLNVTNSPLLGSVTSPWTSPTFSIDFLGFNLYWYPASLATFGCTEETACNYDATPCIVPDATMCEYAAAGFDCDGNPLGGLTCDEGEVSLAVNYDGADGWAEEFTFALTDVDGNVLGTGADAGFFEFCVPADACIVVTLNDSYGDGQTGGEFAPDGTTTVFYNGEVLESVTGNWGSSATILAGNCTTSAGCMDAMACNYDATATEDDGSCVYFDTDIFALGEVMHTTTFVPNDDCPGGLDLANSYGFPVVGTPDAPIGFTITPEQAASLIENLGSLGELFAYEVANASMSFCGTTITVDLQIAPDFTSEWSGDYYPFTSLNTFGVPSSVAGAGCNDPVACNYEPCAGPDPSLCTYPEAGFDCDGNASGCGDDEDQLTVSYDGLDGFPGEFTFTVVDESGMELGSGAGAGTFDICIPAGACVTVTLVDDYGDGQYGYGGLDGTTTVSLNGEVVETFTGNWGDSVTAIAGGCPDAAGCTAELACNYNPEANTDDGSCEFAPDYYECDGETCINDTDGDGVCDELEVEGCVVPTACNYVSSGVTQLVPCVYPDPGYNCDGTCISDTDGDGTCDANEIVGCQDSAACNYDASATDEGTCDYDSCLGCTDEVACNYDDSATQDDGTCDFCSCANEASGGVNGFNLSVETHAEGGIPGLTTYRVYVTTPNATDFVSAIAGDAEVASYLRTSTSFYQNPLGGLTAGAINPLFFGSFPDIQYDSWLTIGIDQAPVPGDGTADVTIAQAAGDTWPQDFEAGGNLEMDSFFGGSWFTTNLTSNGVAGDDLKVLVAQLTTDGSLTGQLFVQVFPLGVGADAEYLTLSFGNSTCGCTDASACNYSEGAIYDDGSCFFVGIYDCDASCVNDADQDGVCDELEIVGCSDSEACNYNPDATDEGACEYVEPTLLPSEGGCGLFFSGYAEGSSNHKFMEIYNPTDADIDLSGYAFPNVSNAPDNGAGNYDFWNAFPEGAMIAAGDVYVIAHGSADASILAEADMTFNFLSNGDDGFMLVQGDEANYIMIDAIGDFNGDPGSGWDVAGVTNGTQNHSLIRKSNITSGNGGDWIGSAGTDAENSEWIVLDQDDWTGVGSHEFTGDCAAGNYAVIYDCDGVCLNDSDQDGVCDEIEVDGCTDSGACNYNLLATDEDGSCEYLTCAGCTDPVGCNYDLSATIEDGSCTYPEAFYDCDGNCVNDLNINGICDELEVLGCTYSAACNYDMDANVDDGQCDFSCLLTGCTDSAADNYDAAATVDDGNCFYVGCLDSNALNYDSGANFPGNCEYCEGDFNYDGEVDVNDLLDFFQLWGNTCD